MFSLHNQDPRGGRRLVCWSCMAQYHLNCMLSNLTQIVRFQMTKRRQCTNCSQKLVADSKDNQKAQVLDTKSTGIHQPQLFNSNSNSIQILQWKANNINRELPLQEGLLKANNLDLVYSQKMKLQPKTKTPELQNFSAVQHDRKVEGEARDGPYNLH